MRKREFIFVLCLFFNETEKEIGRETDRQRERERDTHTHSMTYRIHIHVQYANRYI